ncbi:hypothetical protein EGR_07567 [Echinococcus granulosus]|uniref:Uncharacterized protein n=1 Tax=Echinococcus granulosus TaxID=6210 RepID=W6UAJ7_ECHGR|nr:hypothetical protein EGR_07567 [Echinococcus granulosus]EUB57556.1 hypothetical protein EGR_07567 [Echinococcus granulosus]
MEVLIKYFENKNLNLALADIFFLKFVLKTGISRHSKLFFDLHFCRFCNIDQSVLMVRALPHFATKAVLEERFKSGFYLHWYCIFPNIPKSYSF